jgi:tRNA-specific 2-thiouridylase
MPFYVLNLEREFDAAVLQPFLAGYLEGRTPSPCVDCNSYLKFGALLGRALRLYGCEAVATGHYARVETVEDAAQPEGRRYRLLRGRDAEKDQSYFLYGLRQDQLARTRFPLGELTKAETRAVARRHGLATADKPESQEICFVPSGDYREALRVRAGWEESPGPLRDVDGAVVGTHRGAAAYTVGQRQGLGVALGEPRYVRSIDAAANLVTLGRREDLQRDRFGLTGVSFVAGSSPAGAPDTAFRADVRIRHRAEPIPALVRPDGSAVNGLERGRRGDPRSWTVELERTAWAPAPGQAAVFYRGDEVLGGGRISAA